MAGKQQCWDFKDCGRIPGGEKSAELGVCPAATDTSYSGVNSGENGGRFCWVVTGTLCGGEVQGTYAQKELNCLSCEFMKIVKAEEGANFHLLKV